MCRRFKSMALAEGAFNNRKLGRQISPPESASMIAGGMSALRPARSLSRRQAAAASILAGLDPPRAHSQRPQSRHHAPPPLLEPLRDPHAGADRPACARPRQRVRDGPDRGAQRGRAAFAQPGDRRPRRHLCQRAVQLSCPLAVAADGKAAARCGRRITAGPAGADLAGRQRAG